MTSPHTQAEQASTHRREAHRVRWRDALRELAVLLHLNHVVAVLENEAQEEKTNTPQ